MKVVDNWRAAHAFPLQVISELIEQALPNHPGILKVQRLKRLESIVGKLQRPNNTGLYRMQDLAGCRVIVPSVDEVYTVVEKIKKKIIDEGCIIKKTYNYLQTPPVHSGYRSFHLVVQYQSSNEYNGMLIEIQVRTRLQHTWATAVEIIDCIERNRFITTAGNSQNGLKAGEGSDIYRHYFKLVSGLFSISEGTSVVDGVPETKQELIEAIYHIEKSEQIKQKLASYSHAIKCELPE